MTYIPDYPPAVQSPKDTVVQINTNFAQFAAKFSTSVLGNNYNHEPFNVANQGKHGSVIIQNRASDPGVNQDLTVLYNKNYTAATGGSQAQLFAQIPKFLPTDVDTKDKPNTGMLLTYNQVNVAGPVYQSFLAGGYLIYFGQTTGMLANTVTVTVAPTPVRLLMVQAFPGAVQGVNQAPHRVSASIIQPDKVKIDSTTAPNGTLFIFMAIGVA